MKCLTQDQGVCDKRWSVSSPQTPLCQPQPWSKLLPKVQVYVRSRSSHFIMFLLLSCAVEGGSRASRTRTREVPPQEGVNMFVLFAGHRKECVTEMVRVESTDSPCSATLIKKYSKNVQIPDKKQKEVAARQVEEKAIKLGKTLRGEVG